jgi:hypothetical protein
LPYADPAAVELFLQDTDISGPENLDVQLLTRNGWIGQKKARAAAPRLQIVEEPTVSAGKGRSISVKRTGSRITMPQGYVARRHHEAAFG